MNEITEKRVHGGSGWADSMFRFNADTASYVRGMLERAMRKSCLDKDEFEMFFSENNFILFRNNHIIIQDRFDHVEEHRRISLFSFENWMETQINLKKFVD